MRKEGSCKEGPACPECGLVADYDRGCVSDQMQCERCGREFEVQRKFEVISFRTFQMGVCPVCKRIVEITRDKMVRYLHTDPFGVQCPGADEPALMQPERGQIRATVDPTGGV